MDMETVAKWFEFDYLPRVGAYRKDCKIGCDVCIPKHDGDNYCDIDMLCKVLSLLKERKAVEPYITGSGESFETAETWWYECGNCNKPIDPNDKFCRYCGYAVKWE